MDLVIIYNCTRLDPTAQKHFIVIVVAGGGDGSGSFIILFLILFLAECVSAKEPSIYIQLSWDMSWTRLCDLLPLFAKKLSGELYELGTLRLVNFEVNVNRIRFMNDKAHCEGSRSTQVAVLDFFISKSKMDLGNSDVDGNITILAYTKLHDYWRNNKMHLLDAVFLEKVE